MTSRRRRLLSSVGLALLLSTSAAAQGGPFNAQIEAFWNLLRVGGRAFTTVAVTAGGYLSFGQPLGSSGYGIRDNSGVIEVKDSGGSWNPIGGGGAGTVTFSGTAPIDNAITRYNGTSGESIQAYTSGSPTIGDTGIVSVPSGVGVASGVINANIGGQTNQDVFDLRATFTNLSTSYVMGSRWTVMVDPSAPGSAETYGINMDIGSASGNVQNLTRIEGIDASASHAGMGTINGLVGMTSQALLGTFGSLVDGGVASIAQGGRHKAVNYSPYNMLIGRGNDSIVYNVAGGKIPVAEANYGQIGNQGAGEVTFGADFYADAPVNSGGGSFLNDYGVYIVDHTLTGTLKNFQIYSAGPLPSYHGGNFGFGTETPGSTTPGGFTAGRTIEVFNAAADARVSVCGFSTAYCGDFWSKNADSFVYLDGRGNDDALGIYFRTKTSGTAVYNQTLLGDGSTRLGKVGTTLGVLKFSGSSSGTVTVQPSAAAGTATLTLPSTTGSIAGIGTPTNAPVGFVSGVTELIFNAGNDAGLQIGAFNANQGTDIWQQNVGGSTYIDNRVNAPTGDIKFRVRTLGTPITAFTVTGFGEATLGVTGTNTGILNFQGATSGNVIMTVGAAAGAYSIILPPTDGAANKFITSNGSGQWSWVLPSFTTQVFAPDFVGNGSSPAIASTTMSSCGTTNPAMDASSTDTAGGFTVGTVSGTDCTLTMAYTAPHVWVCMGSNATTANLLRWVPVNTTSGKFQGTLVGGDHITYQCHPY